MLTERRLLHHQLGRIRDVRLDATGALYVLTDGGEGELYRVELPQSETRGGVKSQLRDRRARCFPGTASGVS